MNRFVTAHAFREIGPAPDLIEAFTALRGSGRLPWLLDSALDGSGARFSFAGSDPYMTLQARGERVRIEVLRDVRPDLSIGVREEAGDPLSRVRSLMPPPPAPCSSAVPFLGGAIGCFGYELAEHCEPVVLRGADDLGLPDLQLLFSDRMLVCDHERGRLYASALGFSGDPRQAENRAAEAADVLCGQLSSTAPSAWIESEPEATTVRADFDASSYAKAVDEARGEIAAGEIYQACMTHRLQVPFDGPSWPLYRRLRRINPAPFAAYLELPGVTVLSSSPERFLRLDAERNVEARPIKGTRPLGSDAGQEEGQRAALACSEKDRAENVMIVDLYRNDLGRVCETGSVHVPDLLRVERHPTLHQLVSTVSGRLRSDRDALDLLRATFPPGSMTGAPKIAAMRILDRLEPVRRGLYSGALGYLDVRGGLDLSVVIRTILLARGSAFVHAGGGVVADSDPIGEWCESLDKAAALLEALGVPPDAIERNDARVATVRGR